MEMEILPFKIQGHSQNEILPVPGPRAWRWSRQYIVQVTSESSR